MDALPAEVLHLICRELSPTQAAAARFINKRFAEIAAFYMVDTVTFYTSRASFERLRMIAEHPVFHQTIKCVVYTSNVLRKFDSASEGYFGYFRRPEAIRTTTSSNSAMLSPRAERLVARNRKKNDASITRKYLIYLEKLHEQKLLLTEESMATGVSQQLAKLPHLESVFFLPHHSCAKHNSTRFAHEFDRRVTPVNIDLEVSQVQAAPLLLPHGSVSHSLRDLTLHAVDVRVFEDVRNRDSMIAAFVGLRTVDIDLVFIEEDSVGYVLAPEQAYERILGLGGLKRSLAAAKNLVKLKLGVGQDLDPEEHVNATQYLIPEVVWPKLTHLELKKVSLDPEKYVSCLRRQPKLKEIGLDSLVLVDGTWIDVIDELRNHVNVATVQADNFLSEDLNTWWLDHLDETMYCDGLAMDLSAAIEMYICDPCYFSLTDGSETDAPNPLTDYENFKHIDELEAMYGWLDEGGDWGQMFPQHQPPWALESETESEPA